MRTTRYLPTESDIPLHGWSPYGAMHQERIRAHAKHGAIGSMEQKDWNHPIWLAVVGEEFGEVARVLCERQLGNHDAAATPESSAKEQTDNTTRALLRGELTQLGAMVAAWLDAISDSY